MKNIEVRTLGVEDWGLLRSMRIRSATLHPDLFYDTPQTAANKPASHWQNLLSDPNNRFFAFYDGERCVGITGVTAVDAKTGMIGYSFIEPELRGQGLVDRLYQLRLDHAVKNTLWDCLVTDHRVGNEPSRKCILKYGFEPTETVIVDWPDGTRDYECRYQLNLTKLRVPAP